MNAASRRPKTAAFRHGHAGFKLPQVKIGTHHETIQPETSIKFEHTAPVVAAETIGRPPLRRDKYAVMAQAWPENALTAVVPNARGGANGTIANESVEHGAPDGDGWWQQKSRPNDRHPPLDRSKLP